MEHCTEALICIHAIASINKLSFANSTSLRQSSFQWPLTLSSLHTQQWLDTDYREQQMRKISWSRQSCAFSSLHAYMLLSQHCCFTDLLWIRRGAEGGICHRDAGSGHQHAGAFDRDQCAVAAARPRHCHAVPQRAAADGRPRRPPGLRHPRQALHNSPQCLPHSICLCSQGHLL